MLLVKNEIAEELDQDKIMLLVFSVSHAILNSNSELQPYAAGSTRNIEEVFVGRCYEYRQCLQQDRCIPNEPTTTDCDVIWEQFSKAFAYEEPCLTLEDRYDEVLGIALPYSPEHQTLFWSGTMEAALNVARVSQYYRILEETLPGYMANKLVWCGDPKSTDGINYISCPDGQDPSCERETRFVFWQAASREFAKQAKGRVSVALNSHREGGAFNEESVFANIELPNLNKEQVDVVQILLIPDIKLVDDRQIPEERCDEGSVLILERMIEDLDMLWECIYDPVEFNYIQCTTLMNPEDYKSCNNADLRKSYSVHSLVIIAILSQFIIIPELNYI